MDNNVWNIIFPILIVVLANTMYNICAKSTPGDVNPFGTLMITYLVAVFITLIIFVVMVKPENVAVELSKINWTAFALAISVVLLEVGYILIYRAGWNINNASLVANICLACSLLVVGLLMYNETLNAKQIIGFVICIIGLIFVTG